MYQHFFTSLFYGSTKNGEAESLPFLEVENSRFVKDTVIDCQSKPSWQNDYDVTKMSIVGERNDVLYTRITL